MVDPVKPGEALDVLMISQPVEYGVAVCVRQLAEAGRAAGHRVVVACPGSENGPLADWIKAAGGAHVTVNLVRRPALTDLRDFWAIRRLARGRDVVHLHSSKAGALGRMAVATLRRRHRPAVIFTPHYWSWQVGGRMATVYRWVERLLAPRCDAIVAVSEQEAAEGRARLGSSLEHLVVIPNGVDRKQFSPEGAQGRRDPDTPLIVCVGRLSKQKGQDIAIRALAQLKNQAAHLRLVGDENPVGEREFLAELAESLGVADRVEWHGKVDDPAPEFRAADIVAAPSRWEGMSLVFLEAMACGAPVVVTDVFGSEAVGPAGVIVPPENSDALAHALDDLLDDEDRRLRLSLKARERSELHDLARTLRRNLEVWHEISRGSSAAWHHQNGDG
jgi:glycosyltransferase involved in cell wall biosynthesis